jgi:sodium transport system permease protein
VIRARQIARVAGRHLVDLRRDRRTLMTLVLFPILTVVLIGFLQDEIAGSISGGARVDQPIAVQGARYGGEFLEDLRAFANVRVIETDDARREVRDERALVGLVIPKGFARRIASGKQVTVEVIQGTTSVRASIAEAAVQGAINGFANRIVTQRLRRAGLPPDTAHPITLEPENVATKEERSGNALGQFLPILVISQIAGLMGATAVDATTGEKERRTIEALVATPLRRREILVGKWLFTAGVGVLGVGLTVSSALIAFRRFSVSLIGGDVTALPAGAITSLLFAGIAIALVMAAAQLVVGVLARSTQQAGMLAAPLFLLLIPLLFSLEGTSGTTVPAARYAVPLLGPAMLARFGLAGTLPDGALTVALVSSVLYAAALLMLGDRVFRSERALLRV